MKALCIDCAVSKLTISAKNDDRTFTSIYDIGMKQSEVIVPAISTVLQQVDLQTKDLDYTALTVGPGSFTGLRLGISALKAIELAYNVPVYGLSSLKVYEYAFLNFDSPVLTVIDANKDKFYARLSYQNEELLEDGDYESDFLIETASKYDKIILCGPDAKKFETLVSSEDKNISTKFITSNTSQQTAEALFALAEKQKTAQIPPLQDYDGPIYLRASEAEIKLNSEK
ncbi:MAG: tRNA (adenosine(37)-N6)-threonylcarbamoyltransferase complex dimerization subunit type 1 TsaB [Treponema sp.]|nr:tRNA (adenosine(37)-N6)-threonylcarbamoyltransferase complex dimerization subunit type 1 TsaB [Treponema sp.]